MAKVSLNFLPTTADQYTVIIALARILHSDEFRSFAKEAADPLYNSDLPQDSRRRLLNFKVELKESRVGTTRNDGTGILTLPSDDARSKFLDWVVKRKNHVYVEGKKIRVQRAPFGTREHEAMTLSKTPYLDPGIEREHQEKVWALHEALRVDFVQFGFYYRDYPSKPIPDGSQTPLRKYSVEWEKQYFHTDSSSPRSNSPGSPSGVAWLRLEYDHKLIRIQLGDESTEYLGSNINITFASISKIAIGYDPQPYICFDTLTPPALEGIKFHRTLTGDEALDARRSKTRIGSLEPGHLRVAPYAQQLRLVLYRPPTGDILQVFSDLCFTAGLPKTILARFNHPFVLEASKLELFSAKRLHKLDLLLRTLDWEVAFQIEALLRNALLHTDEIDKLIPRIKELVLVKGSSVVSQMLLEYRRHLRAKSLRESPLACFARVSKSFTYHPLSFQSGSFNCCHVTVTPTRLVLEGPFPVQSNRIIRKYQNYEDHFLRVDFRDEDKMQYRWDREVDGSHFVRERVGGILKNGLTLGGRDFEFLAYSTSALRGHAVWFMNPFKDEATGRLVTSESIRNDIGDFAGTPLLKSPSKYAARLAQAFTATDPSVRIGRHQWMLIPDIVVAGHENDTKLHSKFVYTDGVGTISSKLATMIWDALCEARHYTGVRLRPSAFQIRFLGFKGVVCIDHELDKREDGIMMCLRPSMKKFESDDVTAMEAEIEIAMAFEKPNTAYLNRPLVMALEDRGVRQTAFRKLQDIAVGAALTIDDSITQFRAVLKDHSLGNPFRLVYLLEKLEKLGLDLQAKHRTPGIDNAFFKQLRQVAMNDVLREIKHSARIPISESYLLVGVADEGPAYKKAGYTNVFELPPGKIYACVQRYHDEPPIWLEGSCTISRSPVAHVGDVQRVQAIGKPPKGMLCLFEGLKNVVVLPSQSSHDEPRSLASCLGGGDLDGDMYSVIQYSGLLPPNQERPASYPDGDTLTLEDDSTVNDICNFIVEYINSDVLGLLSDRLLVIADQSKLGMHDDDCKWLAELCSQAVDYPKQGIPVDLDHNRLPRTLLRCKPDWHAAEVIDPRKTDYYRSEKALGDLYRAISLDEPELLASDAAQQNETVQDDVSSNAIYRILAPHIEKNVPNYTQPDGTEHEIHVIFQKYVEELRYISITHTLTSAPGVTLKEAEMVLGTILAKCSQKRWRSDCIYRMRYHTQTVVRDIQKQLLDRSDSRLAPEELEDALRKAWAAWDFALRHEKKFGAKSFGLVALGIIFDCLEQLPGARLSL
ncbi:RNA dependent RNA polymerase-domain-containing protein [Roridomyces roridus]|uniref:RNA-dependent RNA polymerase n=1 Tax=Roridomyces roridus TaxID=1738132 RepID=A0AAD7BXD6_9AGAR|nr:RNA dependent RNA polymerase-domain-containing protein [Roridomyces roridus]